MFYNYLTGERIEDVPKNTIIEAGNVFKAGGIQYIIYHIYSYEIGAMPLDEHIKRVTVKKCNGVYMTLKEIEELNINI